MSSPQDEAEIAVGSGPASGSQGGLDHSGRVWRPQQPPGRRPGPRPSEPPHKEMFVPRRRGLWAVAPLAPSSLRPPPSSPPRPPPRREGRTGAVKPRRNRPGRGRGIRPTPNFSGAGWDGRECDVGLDWEVGEGTRAVLGGPPSLLPEGDTLPGLAEAGRKPSRPLPPANCLGPGLPWGGRGWVGRTHLGQPGPWLSSFTGSTS